MKQAMNKCAVMACDSDKEMGKSEFVLYVMKFGNSDFLNKLIE